MLRGTMSGTVPTWFLFLFVSPLGFAFGSFATALIHRVPTSESLSTRSKCINCFKQLTWRENIPLISYLTLRGKCSGCGARISLIYPAIEFAMFALFITPLFLLHSWSAVILWQVLSTFGVPLFVIDLQHHRLPDLLTGFLSGTSFLVILGDAIRRNNFDRIAPSLIGALGLMLFYLLLLILSRGGMGMGDVKLAASMGLISGYFGLRAVFTASFVAFFLGAFVGITLMIVGKAGRKTAIPFGPFMIAGQFIALLIYAR
jgi:leader peptidase (prepilin peptidase) / N-methyltransferase